MTQGPVILAHRTDARLGALLQGRLARLAARPGIDDVTILLATAELARNSEEQLVRKALDAWSRGQLLVVSVDDAIPPLGLRDVERVAWTPGKDDAPQLAEIAAHLEGLVASPAAAQAEEGGRVDPAGSALPHARPLARSRGSRRLVVLTAVLVAGLGFAGVFVTSQLSRNSARSPMQAGSSPPPALAPAPSISPAPSPAPALSPPPTGGERLSPGSPPRPGSPPSAAPDLDKPSGGGGGGGGGASRPAPPPEPEPPAGLPEWAVLALWLVPAFLMLALLHAIVRRRGKPREPVAVVAQTPSADGHAGPSSAMPASPRGVDGSKSIFVSYSHQDISRVDPIIAEIESLGHPVWLDRRELSGGPGWAGQIVRGLRGARTVVLMASRHAYASDQVVREMYLAMSEKKPIVPLELEAAEMPDQLQYILAPFQRHRLEGADRMKIIHNALAAL
jgi:hypothetical protein